MTTLYSSGSYPVASENTSLFSGLSDGYIDTSSLGLLFEGFMIKSGNQTLVGLFDTAISELYFQTFIQQGISHVGLLNVSPIPIPAALWLFAPALLGLMGLRRQRETF